MLTLQFLCDLFSENTKQHVSAECCCLQAVHRTGSAIFPQRWSVLLFFQNRWRHANILMRWQKNSSVNWRHIKIRKAEGNKLLLQRTATEDQTRSDRTGLDWTLFDCSGHRSTLDRSQAEHYSKEVTLVCFLEIRVETGDVTRFCHDVKNTNVESSSRRQT